MKSDVLNKPYIVEDGYPFIIVPLLLAVAAGYFINAYAVVPLLLLTAMALILVTQWRAMFELIGDGTLLAMAIFVVCGLIVGHLLAPALMFTFVKFRPEPMVMITGFTIGTVALSLYLLPRLKGALVGLQWANRMHGFGAEPHD